MDDWFAPTCQLLTSERTAAFSLVCAALALLLVALVTLGFGPLRAWLGQPVSIRTRAVRGLPGADRLLDVWRLDRELRRSQPPRADFLRREDERESSEEVTYREMRIASACRN